MAATLLGHLQHLASGAALTSCLWRDETLAISAALALGDLQQPWTLPALLHQARTADSMTVRVACAAASLRLGHRNATVFLIDVLGANLPGRGSQDQRSALPRRERWAFERELALVALEACAHTRFGYDPNASHPSLLAAVARWEAWAETYGPTPPRPVDPGVAVVVERVRHLASHGRDRQEVDAALLLLEALNPQRDRRGTR
jgi:hypothetical protein